MGKKKNAVIIILLVLICIGIIVTVVFLSKNGNNTIKEGGSSELTKASTEATTNPTTTQDSTTTATQAPTQAPTQPPTQVPTEAPTEQFDVIKYTNADTLIMPDKYNTGAKGTLTESGLANKIGTIQFAAGNNGTANVLDFYYRNGDVEG
ncbi:MAG: hypothetical protein IJY81_01245, partial [Lachnospiraceae bacterium]|nr:hypothetical protein [Lachnospiraceae bacterium]